MSSRSPRFKASAKPAAAPVLFRQAVQQQQAGRTEHAMRLYAQVLRINPTCESSAQNLTHLLFQQERYQDSIAACKTFLHRQPGSGMLWYHQACAHYRLDQWEETVVCALRAHRLLPNHFSTQRTLANALGQLGRAEEALEVQYALIALQPQEPRRKAEVGMRLLQMGDYANGWHGWKHFCGDSALPQWDGKAHPDQTLVVCGEQGLGDIMQFARYLPLLRPLVKQLVLMTPMPLQRLFQQSDLADAVYTGTLEPAQNVIGTNAPHGLMMYVLPSEIDMQCGMALLPALFDTRVDTMPQNVPYLRPDPADVETWRQRLGRDTNLRVGLRWAGSPDLPNDRFRSARLADFAPLFSVPGVTFYSLQKQDKPDQVVTLPSVKLIDHSAEWKDFADTAAFMQNLDLVISVDTSCCHLAGALGLPTWTLIMPAHEWRWMLEREDSPWYPTMRLFRQDRLGQWQGVIRSVTAALQERVTQHQGR